MLAVPEDGKAVAAIVKLIGKEIPPTAIPGIEPAVLTDDKRRFRNPRPAARSSRRDRQPVNGKVSLANTVGSNVAPFPGAANNRPAGKGDTKGQDSRKVVGFGDHLPAFLSRPPRITAYT
jgi:hypothetical protein